MENQNRVGKVLLLLAGFAIVLCVGMAIGGVLVFGVMQLDDLRASRADRLPLELGLDELFEEQDEEGTVPGFAAGAVIIEVLPDTPAEQAGLQEGDIVVAVDSQRLGPAGNLARLIAQYEPGDRVTLQVRRGDGEPRSVRVKLGENPDAPGAPYLGVRYQSAVPGGMPFRELLPLDELPMPLPGGLGGPGIIVISVTEGSPAEDAGLQHGDLITSLDGEPLASAEALTDAVAQRQPGDRVTLAVIRAGDEGEVELELRLGEHPEQAGKAYMGVTVGDTMRFFRGPQNRGQGLPHDELPFNWDDLRRWFEQEQQPHLDDDGTL
jgi:S1-C subfamily serine protease